MMTIPTVMMMMKIRMRVVARAAMPRRVSE